MSAIKLYTDESNKTARRTGSRLAILVLAVSIAVFAVLPAAAEEGFGFGDLSADTEEVSGAGTLAPASGVGVAGRADYDTTAFFAAADAVADTPLSGIPTARLDFKAQGASVDAALRLKINEAILNDSPESLLDEASVRIDLGKLDLEGGLLKRSWGKADNEGPLDVLNPYDRSDLSVTEILDRKIAQPMLCATVALGSFSELEAVFLPGFEGHRIAAEGIWAPAAVRSQKVAAKSQIYDGLYASNYAAAWSAAYSAAYAQILALNSALTAAQASSAATAQAELAITSQSSAIAAQADAAADGMVADMLDYPDTRTLEYAQGGMRFTTTLAGADLGFQYFYGYLPTPVASADPGAFVANGYRVPIGYNRYHQAGVDLATVLLGLNLRAELAANVTEDLEGDDPLTTNPAVAWALGFDRDLFAGISLNVQGSGSLRLLDDKVGTGASDVEKDTESVKTRVLATIMQKLLKDTVEWKMTAVYDVQDGGLLLNPTLAFIAGDARIEAKGGYFTGGKDSDLGQFADASYARISFSYAF
ncbi:MAG TPA: hypothetical protein DIC34_18100 [Treponema sp.]|nr:MAG: hypothetical protein A2001_06980 [Treponema sp. GWC1_61_84]OHE71958.1 MAG: hypothetical protein A2413_00665 [Treponema sp. RIFOXYC1_FULL_61_9]HCM28414.1 hypothetical protein [Treponema sp.]